MRGVHGEILLLVLEQAINLFMHVYLFMHKPGAQCGNFKGKIRAII